MTTRTAIVAATTTEDEPEMMAAANSAVLLCHGVWKAVLGLLAVLTRGAAAATARAGGGDASATGGLGACIKASAAAAVLAATASRRLSGARPAAMVTTALEARRVRLATAGEPCGAEKAESRIGAIVEEPKAASMVAVFFDEKGQLGASPMLAAVLSL
mmetsp:Transcript_40511/g.99494  ORF Transcript_40511/g.99494 Transcript_40511/m.99494 type:complete len:159 (+) Transcript_40511:298-774(+)